MEAKSINTNSGVHSRSEEEPLDLYSLPSEELRFAVIAIEETAKRYGIPAPELVARLQKQGLIEGRLWKYYDLLHTQSREYVADDLMECLLNREQKTALNP